MDTERDKRAEDRFLRVQQELSKAGARYVAPDQVDEILRMTRPPDLVLHRSVQVPWVVAAIGGRYAAYPVRQRMLALVVLDFLTSSDDPQVQRWAAAFDATAGSPDMVIDLATALVAEGAVGEAGLDEAALVAVAERLRRDDAAERCQPVVLPPVRVDLRAGLEDDRQS